MQPFMRWKAYFFYFVSLYFVRFTIALTRIKDMLSLSTSVVVRFIQGIRDVIPV